MAHIRTQIRTAAVAALTGLATTGARVKSGRVLAIDPEKSSGPILLVACGNEKEILRSSQNNPHEQTRELELLIRGIAKATATLEDTLDQIALEVEQALAGASALRTMMQDLALVSIHTGIDESMEKPAGVILLTYTGHYYCRSNTPNTLA